MQLEIVVIGVISS